MRTRSRRGQTKFFILTVVLPRVASLLIPVVMYLESNGFRIDAGALQIRVVSGVLALLFLYTPTGRRLLLVAWLFAIAIIVANLKFIEFKWETMKLLGFWLALGGLWFVDWGRVIGRLNRPEPTWTASAGRPARKQVIRECRVSYALDGGRSV